MKKDYLKESLTLACEWLVKIAQVKDEVPTGNIQIHHKHTYWKGAIKGEYSVKDRKWSFFCPIWHTGQAVKSLVMAHKILKEDWLLEGAKAGADFIVHNQIRDKSAQDCGLVLAYEDAPDKINTSAILECLDGLILLSEATGEESYWQAALDAARWALNKMYLGDGLFYDGYDPTACKIIERPYRVKGRPLLDDGILWKAYKKTGERRFFEVFLEVCERLLRDEEPPGNWVNYPPCNPVSGTIHPRHAYWWGRPMIYAFQEIGDRKYLACALRSGEWYQKAQRRDGGLIRGTYRDFSTDSFGHATSGICCAMILWQELEETLGEKLFQRPLELALEYCLNMQFRQVSDPNLKGCILEKVLPPDGTDGSPYYIRDLGTIFFVQAVSMYLEETFP
ncbi:MAG: hypothetical protein KAT86_01040 [Candidatus Latescibacteria bacterium]|nr:hypothetical protein [Candidatus Latescibacterota bacterium]